MPFDPLDLFRRKGVYRVDPAELYAPFLARLLAVLSACQSRGALYYATSGQRGMEAQRKLHLAHLAGGPKAAPAGLSAHQYGIAVDVAPDSDVATPGLQGPDYSARAYAILVEECAAGGLVNGGSFGDLPHVQWPGFVSGAQLMRLRDLWRATDGPDADRMRAVWRYLDRA